jgi:hypothetical protein
MKTVTIPSDVFATEIRAGRIQSGEGAVNVVGDIAAALAADGLKKAASGPISKRGLLFPPVCCNCLAGGSNVRSVDSYSIVNRGVAYTFRFAIPHCPECFATANRKRPGVLGFVAGILGISVPLGITIALVGAANNIDALIYGSLLAAPAVAAALIWGWIKLVRRPRGRQASAYQAVYANGIDVMFAGTPTGFDLVFENEAYADRFIAMNREAGLEVRST